MINNYNCSEESENTLKIAKSYAKDSMSEAIEPAHLLKAVLHKDSGLVGFLESIDKDYYYLLDWASIRIEQYPKVSRIDDEIPFSSKTEAVLSEAKNCKLQTNANEVEPLHILAALTIPGVGFTYEQLKTLTLSTDEILQKFQKPASSTGNKSIPINNGIKTTKNIQKYTVDRRDLACRVSATIVGFEKELQSIFEILGKKAKSNVLIKGASGVGKTALVTALVQRIVGGECPDLLKNSAIYELDLSAVSSEANYKGEIDDRVKKVFAELTAMENPVLIIESIDKIFDKQSQLNGIATLLKKELERNTLKLVATTLTEGYTKNIEHDKEFTSKIEKLNLEEPDFEVTLSILKGAKQQYETHHELEITEELLPEAIRLAKRYMTDRCLPDSAFDLLDKTLSYIRYANDILETENKRTKAEHDDLQTVIAKTTGIPIGKLQAQERDKLMNAESILKERVVGQDHAIKSVLQAIYESRAGLNKKGKPIASVFFLGPTGTGKTELTKALAEFLFQDESAIIRFDMTEFMESHSVAAMTGAPAGYVGYEEGGLLVNKIRHKPYSIVLFDEIEKAHPDVFNIFFPIMDEGWIHDKLDRVGDFSNALIIFTSNAGSQYIFDTYQKGEVPTFENLKREMLKHKFPDAFLGRLTEMIPFSPISEDIVTQIFDIHFKNFLKTLKDLNINLTISDETKKHLALSEFSPALGARPILGIIRNEIRRPLSKLIIEGKVKAGDNVELKFENGKYEWEVK